MLFLFPRGNEILGDTVMLLVFLNGIIGYMNKSYSARQLAAVLENLSDLDQAFEALLTKKQLADRLALSPSFINKLMSEEGLPHFKIGRAVRFRVREVVAWLQKGDNHDRQFE